MANDERLEFLGQVAVWYYEDQLDQSEIGRRIGKSRSMVSRLLGEARDAGLVHIGVNFPLRTDSELGAQLVERYGLADAHVLASSTTIDEVALGRLGRLAARAVQPLFRSEMTVTIGWGAALHGMVRSMPDILLSGIMVLQAMGSVGDGDPKVDGSDLARTLAGKLNGDFRALAAPLIVGSSEAARSLREERTIAMTLRLAEESSVALIGIGSIDSSISGLVRAGYFDGETLERLRANGVVGDVMGYLIDGEGRVVDMPENDLVVGLHPNRLTEIDTVVAVAGGEAKAAAITAALRAGLVDVLVTDGSAARLAIDAAQRQDVQVN